MVTASGPPLHVVAVGRGAVADDRVGDGGHLGVGEPDGALRVDPVDDRVEPADRVGATGGGVVVGGVVERLDDRADGGIGGQAAAPGLLQRVLGEQGAGADGRVAALL